MKVAITGTGFMGSVHAEALDDVGILATPLEYHTPKLPGLDDQ